MGKKQPKSGFFTCKKYFYCLKKNGGQGKVINPNHFTLEFFFQVQGASIYMYILPLAPT
jgi:hypothetical protein